MMMMTMFTYNLQNVHDKNRIVQKSELFRSKFLEYAQVVGASAKCWLHLALNPRFSSEVVGSTQAVNGVYGEIAYVTPLFLRFTQLKVLYSESL
jgi:hypothetical protein